MTHTLTTNAVLVLRALLLDPDNAVTLEELADRSGLKPHDIRLQCTNLEEDRWVRSVFTGQRRTYRLTHEGVVHASKLIFKEQNYAPLLPKRAQ